MGKMKLVKKISKKLAAQVANWEEALKQGVKFKNDDATLRQIAELYRVDFQKLKEGLKYL